MLLRNIIQQLIIKQMQPIQNFLLEIKYFLMKNKKIQGAQYLLQKLNSYLEMLTETPTPVTNHTTKQAEQQYQIMLESQQEIQIESKIQKIQEFEDNTQVQQFDLTEYIISPRKFANFSDIFILQYHFQKDIYQILPFFPTQKNSQLNNDRKAIQELILFSSKQHCIQKQKTNSMTQIHKLTSNIAKNYPPLILPNYSGQQVKYIYIYETKQCLQNKKKYYLVDRYYCFVTDGLATNSIESLFKSFKNRVFQERILKVDDPMNVNSKFIRDSLSATIPLLVDQANQVTLKLQDPCYHPWVQLQYQYTVKELQSNFRSPILLFLTYLAICQFKIVLVVSKDLKHMLSNLLISIEGALRPLKYAYPIVFCTLTKMHIDFTQSPVPLTIGYWGSQKRRQKFNKQLQIYLQQNNSPSTIGIDLEKNQIVAQTGMSSQDIFIIQKLNLYIKKQGKGQCLWIKISNFIQETLQVIQKNQKNKTQQKCQWRKLLENRLKQSQIYQIYNNKL